MSRIADPRVEVTARAMYEATVPPDPEWDLEDDYIKNNWRGRAKTVLAALDAHVGLPEVCEGQRVNDAMAEVMFKWLREHGYEGRRQVGVSESSTREGPK